MDYFEDSQKDSSLAWLYGDKSPYHDDNRMSAILTATNENVEEWNKLVQDKNPNPPQTIYSHDYFSDIDDPHGYLSRSLSETVLNTFNANGVPNHKLILKPMDICLVTRSMKASKLATNTRVQILRINSKVIIVKVLDDPNRSPVIIPKIKFKFRLKYGQSYQMIRCQYPLRLAYSFTYNRSQGQTLHKVLLDCTIAPFEHGHLYVACSRHRDSNNIKLYVNKTQLHEHPYDNNKFMPVIPNVVYPTIISNCVLNN